MLANVLKVWGWCALVGCPFVGGVFDCLYELSNFGGWEFENGVLGVLGVLLLYLDSL